MILVVENINNIKVDNEVPSYFIKNKYSKYEYQVISNVLKNNYNIADFKVLYTKNAKPYLDNSNLYLSISHDNDILAICFDDKEVGIDLQFYNNDSIKVKGFLNINSNNSKDIIDIYSKKEAIIKLEGKRLKDINDIDITKYNIKSFPNDDYSLNMAYFLEK